MTTQFLRLEDINCAFQIGIVSYKQNEFFLKYVAKTCIKSVQPFLKKYIIFLYNLVDVIVSQVYY